MAANGSRDDVTAAIAASVMVYVTGYGMNRFTEGHRWAHLAHSFLDRAGLEQKRIRSWILHNEGLVYGAEGNLDRARELVQDALRLKEEMLGDSHPDDARSLTALCWIALDAGRPKEALRQCDRSFAIIAAIDPQSGLLATVSNNRAEALNALGWYAAAVTDFQRAARIFELHYGATNEHTAFPLHGLGEVRLSEKNPAAAIPFLAEALRIRKRREPLERLIADTRFSLSRALWESGRDRRRALALADTAADTNGRAGRPAD